MHPGPDSPPSAETTDARGPAGLHLANGAAPAPFTLCLHLDRGAAELIEARHGLQGWLAATGVVEPQLGDLLLAVGEAANNAYEHSGAVEREGRCPALIEAHVQADSVHLRICDTGRWREPSAPVVGEPQLRGRGRMLMAALVDTVDVHIGAQGTVVELMSRIRPAC